MDKLILGLIDYILCKNVLIVYTFFFLSSLLQMVFPPIPGDVIMVFQGYMTIVSDSFNFAVVLLTNLVATCIGSVFIFRLGYKNGEKVFKYKIIKKYVHKKHMEKATRLFSKYGYFAVLMSKFLPGVNAVMILFSGVFKVRPRNAYFSIFVSSLIHHIICLILGRVVGNNIQNIRSILFTYNSIIIAILATIVIGYMVHHFMFSKRFRRE